MTKKQRDESIQSLAAKISDQAAELKGEIFLSFSYTADIFNRYLEMQLVKRGSNRTRFSILYTLIVQGGSATVTYIAKKVFRSKYAVTRAIDTLERSGLVKRSPVRGDRRLRRVSITEKGLELIEDNLDGRQEISETVLSCLNQKQARELKIILKQLRKHLLGLITDSANQRDSSTEAD